MRSRSVEKILPPPPVHFVGDGFRVHNFIPGVHPLSMQRMDPFIMLDYNSRYYFSPANKPRGVGVHPHRGFETVSIAYHGKIAHHDSAGNSGVIGEGDVQWMTAGSGVLHKEYHEKEFSKKGGLFQMVQIWVNLPAKDKMTPAKYQAIENKDMGKVMLEDKNSFVEIIAGEFKGIKGPAYTFTPMSMFNAKLGKGGITGFNFPERNNTGFLMIEGEIKLNGSKVASEDSFILFNHDGENITIEALKESIVLIISGEPINEPIASYGPFVMNTESEIKKAYEDFYNGKFGHLED